MDLRRDNSTSEKAKETAGGSQPRGGRAFSRLRGYRHYLTCAKGGGKRAHEHNNSYCAARRFVRFLQRLCITPVRPTDIPPLVTRFNDWMLICIMVWILSGPPHVSMWQR